MLNYEYARLVEEDRRRVIADRIKLHRALHPDDPSTDSRPARRSPAGRGISPASGAANAAR